MPRVLSENVCSVESLRTLTDLPFCDLATIGVAEGPTRRLTNLHVIPWGCQGIYTVWVSANGVKPLLVYGGKCAAKDEGIRHRIRVEFNPRQNELRKSPQLQGPSRVLHFLHDLGILQPQWFVSYAVIRDTPAINRIEKLMLAKIDFIANTAFNGPHRLEVLETYFKSLPPSPTAVVGPIPEMVGDAVIVPAEKPLKVKKAQKTVAIEEPMASVEKPKKVKKTKTLTDAEIFEKAMGLIASDIDYARRAYAAVKAYRTKLTSEIAAIEELIAPLKAQMLEKQVLLSSLSD